MRVSRALAVAFALVAMQVAVIQPSYAATQITIDVRPGEKGVPTINMNATDLSTNDGPPVPVAILSTPGFDARTVNVSTICFGDPNNAAQRDCAPAKPNLSDVDKDRDIDLKLLFDIAELGLDQEDTQACLEGQTIDGEAFYGCDAIKVKNGTGEGELPDLTVSVAAVPGAANANDTVQWTATVTNDANALGAITLAPGQALLSWQFPNTLSGVTVAAPAGYACADAGTGVKKCTLSQPDTLAVGETRTFTLTGVLPAAPGAVTVKAKTDPDAVITELNEQNNQGEAAALVQAPNLTAALAPSAGAVNPGDAVTWTATIHNDGPGTAPLPAGTTLVRFTAPAGLSNISFTAPSGFSCAAAGSGTYDCANAAAKTLAAGSDSVFELTANAPNTPGPVEVSVDADPGSAVTETNEADNHAAASVLVAHPNLVTEVTVSPASPNSGDPVTWTATVTNVGPTSVGLAAGTALLQLTYTPDMADAAMTPPAGYTCTAGTTSFLCSPTAADSLSVGADRVFTFTATAPPSGNIDVTGVADPNGAVSESDETDNSDTATTPVTVTLPDLQISLSESADPVDALHSVSWTARITNNGSTPATIPAGTRLVRFNHPAGLLNLFAATPTGYSCFIAAPQIVDCAAGAEVTIPAGTSLDFTLGALAPKEPGAISVTATADPLGVITEVDESNNSDTETTTVQPPDFSIAVSVSPNPVDALGSVTWTARITNDGPAAARILNGTRIVRMNVAAGLLNLAVNTPTGYSCFIAAPETVDCAASTTQTIAPGGFIDIALLGLAPRQPGPITTTMTADPLDVIPEGDETDNVASATTTVQAPDFSITMTGTPDPVDALSSVTYAARVTNDGPANARLFANTRLIRFVVPADMLNLAVNTPTGYSCFISAPQTVDCATSGTVNIAAGSFVDITLLGLAPRTPGPMTVTATADPLGAIPEVDETDNTVSESVTVQPPDFSVALTPSATTVDALHSFSWTARVTNDGPANARLFANTRLIRFVVPADLLNLAVNTPTGYSCFISAPQTVDCATGGTTNIAAGSFVDITLLGLAPRNPGPITVTATADPLDAIPEGDETDNSASSTVVVRVPDLSVALAPSAASVVGGDSVSWTATITNNGPANARLLTNTNVLRFAIPAGLSNVAASGTGFTCAFVSAETVDCRASSTMTIPVGGTVNLTLSGDAPATPGSLTVTSTADPAASIPETDETNNEASSTVTVT